MFSKLFGKTPVDIIPDAIWPNTEARYLGLLSEIKNRLRVDQIVIVCAHFKDTLEQLEICLKENSLNPARWQGGSLRSSFNFSPSAPTDPELYLICSEDLSPNPGRSRFSDNEKSNIRLSFIVTEVYPTPSRYGIIKKNLKTLPCSSRLSRHISLDEKLFDLFGGEQMRGMLKQLGMNEYEALHSSLVTRSVASAQKKIKSRALSEGPASSTEEWFQLYFRS